MLISIDLVKGGESMLMSNAVWVLQKPRLTNSRFRFCLNIQCKRALLQDQCTHGTHMVEADPGIFTFTIFILASIYIYYYQSIIINVIL